MTVRSLVVCGIMLAMLAGCGKAKEDFESSFKESFKKSFVKSCTESAVKAGRNENEVRGKCECAAKYLAEKHTSAELMKLAASTDSSENAQIIVEAVNACK